MKIESIIIVALITIALTGCASTAQIAPASAADVVVDAETATVETIAASESTVELDELTVIENDIVVLDGSVIEFGDGVVEVELLDRRRVRVASLENGDVAWHIVADGVTTGLWQAPLNARVAYGCGIADGGAALSLPVDAARQLERDLAATAR